MNENIETEVFHYLLPVDNIDIILNLSSPITYIFQDKRVIKTDKFHLNGLRKGSVKIIQKGKLNIFGISFYPYGLYKFLNIPISEFTDKTIELEILSKKLSDNLTKVLLNDSDEQQKIQSIEKELIKLLEANKSYNEKISYVYKMFTEESELIKIGEFSKKIGISERQIERLFKNYIGASPKMLSKIIRFQNVSNKMIKSDFDNLTNISQDFYYYDQAHFIKDIKYFTGTTPSKFVKEKNTVKSIIDLY